MIIEAQQVTHRYAGVTPRVVLDDVTVTLSERRIGIIGHNGSGKSTFLRLINGLIIPSAGKMVVDGVDVAKHLTQVRSRVGFLFTDPDTQIIMPTVGEDVAYGLRRLKLPAGEVERRAGEMLAHFGLQDYQDHPAHLLSGGQKQLLALAGVLVLAPQLLIADEPTTLLDLLNAELLRQALARLDQQLILATHHLDLLTDFDRVLCFDGGRIVADGTPAEAIGYYRQLMTERIAGRR